MAEDRLIIQKVHEEQFQGPDTRRPSYIKLEESIGLPIISLFTSFVYPVMLEDSDADMIEGVLQKCDLSKGFYLLLSSPGGDGLSAERIIRICRSYSGTGEYKVIIPGKAKSAATMICLGASEILMGNTSELGPIDPQIAVKVDNQTKRYSLFNIVKSYDALFEKAVNEKEGNLQPYLQQLANYDAKDIEEYKAAIELSKDIAIKVLKTGMMANSAETEIEKKINIFLSPKKVKVHGRPIYSQDAINCGLNVKIEDVKSDNWTKIYELYVRLNNYVSTRNVAKSIESKDFSFRATIGGKSHES